MFKDGVHTTFQTEIQYKVLIWVIFSTVGFYQKNQLSRAQLLLWNNPFDTFFWWIIGKYCVIFTYNRQHFLVDWVLRLEEKPGNSSYITFLLVHQANKEKKYGMTRKENTWIFKALGRNIFKKILRIYLKLMFPGRKTYDSIVCYTTSAHCNIINTITLLSKNERQ